MTYGYGYNAGLRSPKGVAVQELDGDPGEIERAGKHYSKIGASLTSTADELQKLGANEKYKAESIDKVRESARELHGDLRKVGERYEKTGPVLVTYAAALRTARNTTVDPLVDDIIAAHKAHEAAVDAKDDAQDKVDDNNTTWVWETEATDAEKSAAKSALKEASDDEKAAGKKLEDLWVAFDSGYSTWDKAYEDAITGIEKAIDASGIDDTWWEDLLDGLATVATIVATLAVVAALVIGGPIWLAIAAVAGIVALVAHVIMMACGSKRVSWTDIAFDVLGVLPFMGAFAKAVGPGVRSLGLLRGTGQAFKGAFGFTNAAKGFLGVGRNALLRDLRTVVGAGRGAGNRAARELAAPGLADAFLAANRGSWAANAWNALRSGGSILDGQAYTLSQRLASAWPGAGAMPAGGNVASWVSKVSGMPGLAGQGLNLWNTGFGGYQSLQGVGIPLPDMPDFIGGTIDWIKGN
ncbi:hypothetical protein MUN74_09230 [Agromyces endophyticus]|uniref:hypothetical protein n=1 Tax=Agromyces sp. H17E-10 TaxID=2932244 RepID=UPI001FD314A3|nr:hypothetical protein [Agromyces sp. H17E-10]UOQ91051.1 hypothetical protein MUN74_09230 [Agromyces sp. H17E-10]